MFSGYTQTISLLIVLVSILSDGLLGQQKLSKSEISVMQNNSVQLLEQFIGCASLQDDENNMSDKKQNKLMALFENTKDPMITNFLSGFKQEKNKLSVLEYISVIRNDYNKGLIIESTHDNYKFGKPVVISTDPVIYVITGRIELKVFGLFKSARIINEVYPLYVSITIKGNYQKADNYAIKGIFKEKPAYTEYRESHPLPLQVSISGGPMYSRIYSEHIFNHNDWDAIPEVRFKGGILAGYQLNSYISISSGIGVSTFQTEYYLENFNNENINNMPRTDMDGDNYFLYMKASVDEYNQLIYIDIPLYLHFHIPVKSKIKYSFNAGGQLSFLANSNYDATGNVVRKGYYPEYHVIIYDIDDYGFSEEQIDNNEEWSLDQTNLSLLLSADISIPLSQNMNFSVCPFMHIGLSDLGYNEPKYRNDFYGISGDPGKLTTQGGGVLLKIGMVTNNK